MQLHRSAIVSVGLLLLSTRAHASDVAPPKTSLLGLVEDGNRFVAAAMAGPAPSAREASTAANTEPAAPPPLVDFLPRASVVARDWRGSLTVAGRTMLLDDLRPTASQRMVLARIASEARLSPFLQLGAGEWRVDPVIFPYLPSMQAIAGQLGAGFELRTLAGVQLAGEIDYTVLYRQGAIAAAILAAQTRW